jgi:hypothetical protein
VRKGYPNKSREIGTTAIFLGGVGQRFLGLSWKLGSDFMTDKIKI